MMRCSRGNLSTPRLARQRQHDGTGLPGIGAEPLGQLAAGLGAVLEMKSVGHDAHCS